VGLITTGKDDADMMRLLSYSRDLYDKFENEDEGGVGKLTLIENEQLLLTLPPPILFFAEYYGDIYYTCNSSTHLVAFMV